MISDELGAFISRPCIYFVGAVNLSLDYNRYTWLIIQTSMAFISHQEDEAEEGEDDDNESEEDDDEISNRLATDKKMPRK